MDKEDDTSGLVEDISRRGQFGKQHVTAGVQRHEATVAA